MEYIWIGLLVIALAIILFYKPVTEKMTNKDLIATLKTFGEKGSMPKPKSVDEEPIYGPRIPRVKVPEPAPSNGNNDVNSIYPDIYGPEITPVPGKKQCVVKGKHQSDCHDDDTYNFNPDFRKAFPVDENEPQPFLTDFSKIQQ